MIDVCPITELIFVIKTVIGHLAQLTDDEQNALLEMLPLVTKELRSPS